jgi:prepilin-type N-terminal cleavage/methylation domain-containing protein
MPRHGFTLVELLVVVAIIGLLIAMLLPAVDAAREAGRRAQCANNVKQLGLACLAHDEVQGYFPSGGWGWTWVGDPTLGFGAKQPGSWLYSVLPNLEQDPLHSLGGSDGTTPTTGTQMAGASQCIATLLPVTNCPTRRRTAAYPCNWPDGCFSWAGNVCYYTPHNANPTALLARSDYAANVGDESDPGIEWLGPESMADGLAHAAEQWKGFQRNGVMFTGSQVRNAQITDGASNTYLLGEKYLNPDSYTNGTDRADNESMYSGSDNDNQRSTYFEPPLQDRAGLVINDCFGSAHVSTCCFAFCDGSVHWISYSIDAGTHHLLGSRSDSQPVDAGKF